MEVKQLVITSSGIEGAELISVPRYLPSSESWQQLGEEIRAYPVIRGNGNTSDNMFPLIGKLFQSYTNWLLNMDWGHTLLEICFNL